MKAFGKIAALALTLAMALVLTACGGSGSSSSASASSGSAAASSSAVSVSAAEAGFERGAIQGDTYTNELFAVQFVLPEGFAFLDDEQMASLNEAIGTVLSDDDVLAALESGTVYYDMAPAAEDGANINVVITYAGTPEAEAIDAAGFLKASETQLKSQLEAANMKLGDIEFGTYVNAKTGDEFPSMKLSVEAQGATLYEEMVCLKAKDYFMLATASSLDEAQIAPILENLTLVK